MSSIILAAVLALVITLCIRYTVVTYCKSFKPIAITDLHILLTASYWLSFVIIYYAFVRGVGSTLILLFCIGISFFICLLDSIAVVTESGVVYGIFAFKCHSEIQFSDIDSYRVWTKFHNEYNVRLYYGNDECIIIMLDKNGYKRMCDFIRTYSIPRRSVPERFTLYKSISFFALTAIGSAGITIGVVLNSMEYTIIGPWIVVVGLLSFGLFLTQVFGSIVVTEHEVRYKRLLLRTESVKTRTIRGVTISDNCCIKCLHTDDGVIELPAYYDSDGYFMRYALDHGWLQEYIQ